jgi:unsaturated rhamnogalacturonyl hydrolase
MSCYFEPNESVFRMCGDRVEDVLAAVAGRYVGSNPPHPAAYRAFCADGILKKRDYSYDFNIAERLPEMENGQHVYAWSKYWSDQPATLTFNLHCYGPLRFIANGQQVFKANIVEELSPERRISVRVAMKRGWNHFVLHFTKTEAGCGGSFGPGSYKSNPVFGLAPTPEREGHEGWIYSAPVNRLWEQFPEEGMAEAATGLVWFPKLEWSGRELGMTPMARIFGTEGRRSALAWTKLRCFWQGTRELELRGTNNARFTLYVDGRAVLSKEEAGDFRIPLRLGYGGHDLVVHCSGEDEDFGFRLDELPAGVNMEMPYPVHGASDAWLYLELDEAAKGEARGREEPLAVLERGKMEARYRLDQPNTWVRRFAENPLFGKWNYPLGVTLYGLLQTGKLLGRGDLVDYVCRHIEACTSLYRYAIWDRDKFGASGVLNTLSTLDSLDDCGSFGATMLLALQERDLQGAAEIADLIADYISSKQDRLADGALYRKPRHADFNHATMWCDDLYMSVPFLCRMYQRTGELRYVRDAVNLFAQYKKRLYIPELQIMSHVYDFAVDKPTGVAWGRGNGWVLFSLSELLAVMPDDADGRAEMMQFFNELCQGYLRLQGVNGLWHQVLTDPESYEETSCTSMFVYAFARGVRYGWFKETDPYIAAVHAGWRGMTRLSIDRFGNVYGVCRGSGYSYNASYYKHDLPWLLNDTHGIGIVLLAGIEVLQLEEWLSRRR